MRHLPLSIAALFVAAALSGCGEEEKDYASCVFDPCLFAQCSAAKPTDGETGTQYTCATPHHPHCPNDVCLIFQGSIAFCTRVCDPNSADPACPGGGTCETYDADTGYCVPPAADRPQQNMDVVAPPSAVTCPGVGSAG